jgi:anti-anti-sigma factor
MSDAYDIEIIDDVAVLHLHDAALMQFDSIQSTSSLVDKFFAESETDKLVIDCGQIEFYNSLSLGLVVSKSTKARDLGKTLKYCNLNPQSMWAIQASRLHTILDICHDLEQALSDF